MTAFNRTHGIGISLVLAFALASPASAQVNRCKDAGGKIIYSDKPCDTGQTGRQIERQRTFHIGLLSKQHATHVRVPHDRRLRFFEILGASGPSLRTVSSILQRMQIAGVSEGSGACAH